MMPSLHLKTSHVCKEVARAFNPETHDDAKHLCLDEQHERKAQMKKYL
jgi:hypothetical protein